MTVSASGSSSLKESVLVAGAGGAIGRVLCVMLVEDGWRVVGTTRTAEKASKLARLGVEPILVDVFDREALIRAVSGVQPRVVVHQLTDLPKEFSPEAIEAAQARNARIREVGTDNLVAAALTAGAERLVAQSVAFAYAPGPRPYSEDAPLDAANSPAVVRLEELVLGSGLEAFVLRYGRLYGPGTWTETPPREAPVHVEAAADAARRAVTHGTPGIYNVAEEDGFVTCAKAREQLRWDPGFRRAPDGERGQRQ